MSRLPTGVYRDVKGLRAIVNIAAGRKQKRFPPDTSIKEITRWRNETRVKLERLHPQRAAGAASRGTFSAEVKRYLKGLAIASWKSRRSELRAWEQAFGRIQRRKVTPDHVRRAIKRWTDAGRPPKTILNRIRALTAMYHTLDGPDAWTPADEVTLPKVPRKQPAYVTPATILAVAAELEQQETTAALDPRWRARFMVLAATGARPVFLKRATAADVDLERRLWNIGSAKDGNAILLPLNDDMVAAWERVIATDAWGDFDISEYATIVRAAGWPDHVRPYTLKHALSQDLSEAGVDLDTIADWHGHTTTKTARIYTGIQRAKLKAASLALSGRLGWQPTARGDSAHVDVAPLSAEARKCRIEQLLAELQELTKAGS